ncbi:MAG: hypothetical protein SOR59_00930 [Lachnospiraceae bacterium]|nr:hypothetical protein [Lachnospiraceae bacterium]MDY2956162.1 hypothetical protein [Lachnospiraceae bacterium]
MLTIKEKQELNVKKALSFRGIIEESELESIKRDMDSVIINNNISVRGEFITVTYGIEGEKLDMELIIPIDSDVDVTAEGYRIRDDVRIENAVVASYQGSPDTFTDVFMELNRYITDNNLEPATAGYNVFRGSVYNEIEGCMDICVDVYLGVAN